MFRNSRRLGSLSLVAISAQALAFSALAQTTAPESTRDTTRQSGSATSATTGTGTSADAAGSRSQDRMGQDRMSDSAAKRGAKSTQMANVTPQSFASQAAVLSTAEVELSQLALNNTKNEEIRIFAERMIKDHTAANEKLKKIASQENITVPQALDAEHRSVKQKLSSLKDDAFDREYRKEMAKGHDKAVALFEAYAQGGDNPQLKQWAAKTLPHLKQHMSMAEKLKF